MQYPEGDLEPLNRSFPGEIHHREELCLEKNTAPLRVIETEFADSYSTGPINEGLK